jgi:hypothetical protein
MELVCAQLFFRSIVTDYASSNSGSAYIFRSAALRGDQKQKDVAPLRILAPPALRAQRYAATGLRAPAPRFLRALRAGFAGAINERAGFCVALSPSGKFSKTAGGWTCV